MKTKLLLNVAAAALIAGAVSFAAPAKADPPDWAGHGGHWSHDQDNDDHDYAHEEHHHHHDHDHDHDYHHDHHDHYDHHEDHHHWALEQHDREQIQVYFSHHHDKWCKRHWRQCRPGGTVYAVGAVMPVGVSYEVLPPTIIAAPPPPNAVYVQTGGSVYVMDKTTKTILDAVALAGDLR